MTKHFVFTPRRQQAQRRNSQKSPWRKGPHCKTSAARESWEEIRRDRDQA